MAGLEPYWPPSDGSLSISEVLDFNMQHNGSFPMFRFLAAPQSDQVLEISMLELGRASHRIAHAVRPAESPNFATSKAEVVAIIATLDSIHYHAITMGLLKAGLIVSNTTRIIIPTSKVLKVCTD
jgi:acyl-CoA synthetase (AMP-forming)/AMP-acid ligase II